MITDDSVCVRRLIPCKAERGRAGTEAQEEEQRPRKPAHGTSVRSVKTAVADGPRFTVLGCGLVLPARPTERKRVFAAEFEMIHAPCSHGAKSKTFLKVMFVAVAVSQTGILVPRSVAPRVLIVIPSKRARPPVSL